MNRKIVSILVAAVLAAAVIGCGTQSAKENKSETANQAGSTMKAETEKAAKAAKERQSGDTEGQAQTTDTKAESILFQQYVFDGIETKLPLRWTFSADNSSSESQCFYSGESKSLPILYITAEDNNSLTDIETIKTYFVQNAASSFSANSYTNLHNVSVAGYDGFIFDISGKANDTDVDLRIMAVNNTQAGKIIEVMLGVPQGQSTDLLSDVDYLAENASVTDKSNSFQGNVQSNSTTTTESNSSGQTSDSSGVTPELKEFLDSYESFMDEYVEFLKKYRQNPSDLELLSQYADYMTKLSEFEEKANAYDAEESEMSTADLNYYIEVTTRISQKLLQASASYSTK